MKFNIGATVEWLYRGHIMKLVPMVYSLVMKSLKMSAIFKT